MDFSKHLFRAHMVGKIINVPKPLTANQTETLGAFKLKGYANITVKQKETFVNLENKLIESKKFKLTDANKKTLSELVYATKYGRRTEINSDKITKGLTVEKDCRDILSRVTGLFLTYSKERKQNDWVTGAIDIEPNEVVADIKSSWSWESYSKILESSANEVYLRQLDSYMDLWGKKDSLLCHVLTDTPFKLVEKVIKSLDYKYDVLNIEGDVRDENIDDVKKVVTNHIFSRQGLEGFCEYSTNVYIDWFSDFIEIPEKDRVHMIPHTYDQERIEQRNKSISLSRKYMSTVKSINNFNPKLIK